MRCLIVGADNLGKTPEVLKKKYGVTKIIHWNGRRKKKPPLPKVNLIIILTGFVNHSLVHHVKKEAKKYGLKIIFLKRGKSELEVTA